MAKAKGDWESVLARFEVRGGQPNPVPPTLLSRFEKAMGFILPQSYCGFCRVFGPGRLDGGNECDILDVPDKSLFCCNLFNFMDLRHLICLISLPCAIIT